MHPYQDDSLLIGWTYKTESVPATSDRAELTLPAPVVRDAIDMLNTVADSDGDVRGLLDAVEGVRSALRKAIMAKLGWPPRLPKHPRSSRAVRPAATVATGPGTHRVVSAPSSRGVPPEAQLEQLYTKDVRWEVRIDVVFQRLRVDFDRPFDISASQVERLMVVALEALAGLDLA